MTRKEITSILVTLAQHCVEIGLTGRIDRERMMAEVHAAAKALATEKEAKRPRKLYVKGKRGKRTEFYISAEDYNRLIEVEPK